MIKEFLEIGKAVGTHGVRGEIRVDPWCDSPGFIKQFKTLYLDKNGSRSVGVISCRPHGNIALLKLDGIDTVEQASAMRGQVLFMRRADANIPKGRYFISELIGCTVRDADSGVVYGVISDVSKTGANDVWHVTDENKKEYLLPAIPLVVKSVDVESGMIEITPIRGIFDDAD